MSTITLAPPDAEARHIRYNAVLAELQCRQLDGFLVPLADQHQGEYVPPNAQRLAWLTGFTGSAGLAIVYQPGSAIFVDGRYTLQVVDQVAGELFQPRHLLEQPPAEWLAEHLQTGARIGYDPWLHTPNGLKKLQAACAQAGAVLVACPDNPVDAVWTDQPLPPRAPAVVHPMEYAGESSSAKRQRLGAQLAVAGVEAAVLTQPDSIAWLLNVRGGDVMHAPLVLSFALLYADGRVDWFVDTRKLDDALRDHLGAAVRVGAPEMLDNAIDALGQRRAQVRIDPSTAAAYLFERLEQAGAQLERAADPCVLPKACKNATELAGARAAHERDGVALTRFLHWLAEQAAAGGVDELGAAAQLRRLREAAAECRDISFDSISGSGPNGAIVHYRVTAATNRRLQLGELYLVDSGGQYVDGTTDVTRTVAIGEPSAEQRRHFTLVLKGHIALAQARFPQGTCGTQLDILARQALWQAGLDFDHGTGHGVGSYLCVHEGPQRISKFLLDVPLQPGMIVSNEPGYYKTGAYGIRIENLLVVTEAQAIAGGERAMLGFENLTLAPIDVRLMEPSLLHDGERVWLNAYHAQVRTVIGPHLEAPAREWLEQVTRPV
jgi:Xaa-Pro aminopeptidase